MSQSEPANRCSEKDEEVAPFKVAGKALLLHILIIGQSLGISAVIA